MNIYDELSNVERNQDKLKVMTDNVLDLYKKYPKECKKLLIEINSLIEDFDGLEKELESLKNEIY